MVFKRLTPKYAEGVILTRENVEAVRAYLRPHVNIETFPALSEGVPQGLKYDETYVWFDDVILVNRVLKQKGDWETWEVEIFSCEQAEIANFFFPIHTLEEDRQ